MRFEFTTASRIIFGPGTVKDAGPAAAELGRRALVVTGRTPERAAALLSTLRSHAVGFSVYPVTGEPTTEMARAGVALGRLQGCDLVIGCGGGSAIDAAKAIATLLTNGGDPLDYLEGIGAGKPLTQPALPIIAIPTTAGTGAEVTRNAVIASPDHRVKASLRSPYMLPRLAIVDPELTYGLPPEITAGTGLDALTQLIEPFVSHRANPMTDAFCREGIRRAARSLRRAFEDGDDPPGAGGYGAGESVRRAGAGECGVGRCARLRGADLWHVPCTARRHLRGAAAVRDRRQHPRAASAPGRRPGLVPLR